MGRIGFSGFGRFGISGDGRFGDGRKLGDGIFGDGRLGDGRFGDGTLGDGTLGDGTFGDGVMEGAFGIGLGISFGLLGRAGGIGAMLGGTLRRFSTEWNTSFLVNSHNSWYDIYPAQETTLAHFGKMD